MDIETEQLQPLEDSVQCWESLDFLIVPVWFEVQSVKFLLVWSEIGSDRYEKFLFQC
jgi:hypothetical protein